MAKVDLNKMNSMHYDVLKEIGNIGAGNATTALSKMLNIKIDMKVPKVELLKFSEVSDIVGGAENIVVGILLHLEDDINGMMMFILDEKSAVNIVKKLLCGLSNQMSDFNEMELSALQEIGNIIAGAYLNSLGQLTNLRISPSIPYMSIDMAGAILSVPAIEFGKIGDTVLLIETEFGEDETEVNGYFILVPTLESYDVILESIGL